MEQIERLSQLGSTVATVVLFLYYLNKKDEMNKKTYEEFNTTISNHLHQSNQIIKENSESNRQLSVRLQELTGCIKGLKKKR